MRQSTAATLNFLSLLLLALPTLSALAQDKSFMEIIADEEAKVKRLKTDLPRPKIVFMAGSGGSGKTKVREQLQKLGLLDQDAYLYDTDQIIEKSKEYKEKRGNEQTAKTAANSIFLRVANSAKTQILKNLFEGRVPTIYDSTLSDGPLYEKVIESLMANGWDVEIVHVKTDLETAKSRAKKRFDEGG